MCRPFIILGGPGGTGKSWLLRALRERFVRLRLLAVEFPYYNSRRMRLGEIDAQSYWHRSVEEIEREHARRPTEVLKVQVYKDLHAVDLRKLRRATEDSNRVLTIIQCARLMARQLKPHFPESRAIFLSPVSREDLRAIAAHDTLATCRALDVLRKRRGERPSPVSSDEQMMRDVEAVFQMVEAHWYDEILVNSDDVTRDELQDAFLRVVLSNDPGLETCAGSSGDC